MGPLDSAAKAILREVPQDLAALAPALAGRQIHSARADDTVFSAFSLTMDKLLWLELDREEELTLHVEVEAAWAAEVPREVFAYWSLGHRHCPNLCSLVICLKPGNKQGVPKGVYEQHVSGRRVLRFEFDVVKVWELEADWLMAQGEAGLLPLVPFARGSSHAHVEEAFGALESVEPIQRRGELQAALVAFADNAFPDVNWAARMPEELLMGSSIYEMGEAAGLARGEAAGQRKVLMHQLRTRLGSGALRFAAQLDLAIEETLLEIGAVLTRGQDDEALLADLERLLPTPSDEE